MRILFLLVTLLTTTQLYSAVTEDTGAWINANSSGKIGESTLLYLEAQTRIVEDLNHVGANILRGAFGYSFTDKWSLWAGYGFIAYNFPSHFTENRPYLQSTYNYTFDNLTIINRTRLEFRMLEDKPETALRARHLLRTLYQFDATNKYMLVVWDEFFYNLNSVPGTPQEGFDQNRIFLGIGHKFGKNSHHFVEGGYMNQYVVRFEKNNTSNHNMAFQYIFSY